MNLHHREPARVGLDIPDWVATRLKEEPRAYIAVIQFYVRHVGYHEEWYVYERQIVDHEAWCRAIVQCARAHMNNKWRGVAKDMIVTGGAWYLGDNKFAVTNIRDVK